MNRDEMYLSLGVSDKVLQFGEAVLDELKPRFAGIEEIAELNQAKVIGAMQKNRVNATHFAASTGYGYDDEGRDNLERVYASAFHTEAGLVRPQITCGTHALAIALSANLLPGDEMLAISGKPYDTLEEVIGLRESPCSLKEYGVSYAQVDLREDGSFDFPAIERALNDKTKLIHIQRSKGYCPRPTISVDAIGEAIAFCKKLRPDVVVMVDNCYGEFVEANEPSDFGADMIVGSLIKNPGGGLAPIGGYICGTQKCVDRCAYRLSAPGLGQEVGANLGLMPALYQGFFLAPSVVSGAVKGAVFVAACYEKLGFTVVPSSKEARHDIIQCVELGSPEGMVAFCKGIQSAAATAMSTLSPRRCPATTPTSSWRRAHSCRAAPSSSRPTVPCASPTPSTIKAVSPGTTPSLACCCRCKRCSTPDSSPCRNENFPFRKGYRFFMLIRRTPATNRHFRRRPPPRTVCFSI